MIRSTIVVLGLLSATLAQASAWQKADDAELSFKGSYQGEAFEGRFESFTPTITFDPAALDAASIDVEIQIASAKTGTADYDSTMQEPEFFDGQRFPTARFVTSAIRKTGEDTYEADAQLTLRDKTVPIVFPFRFAGEGEGARLTSTLVIQRLDFEVGNGDWSDTSLIANEVEVGVDLPLKRAP